MCVGIDLRTGKCATIVPAGYQAARLHAEADGTACAKEHSLPVGHKLQPPATVATLGRKVVR